MANWARLQEQLTGLPVVKRSRNSIHFDKGNGEIVANFSGKPCHYQDTDGLWKPIDTKLLLLPDGFYGSPHSDVKIHKDGRVKAGGYQQKSALVAAKEGVVDGDKIVREFKFGTQYLYMKEDGFRQETVITRPPTTAEAKHLIASESGELPSKYKRSDITAVDADGAVHEFVNLGQFKKWLDAAAYPVTIDPDFTASFNGTTINSSNTVYADARTTSNAFNSYTTAIMNNIVGQSYASQTYGCQRGFLKFDTSSIASGSTVTDVTFSGALSANYASDAFDVQVVMQDWSGQDPITDDNREAAFDGCLAGTSAGVWINTGTQKTRRIAYTSESLNTALVTVAGTTYLSLRSSLDLAGTAPDSADFISMFSANETTYQKPMLTITYTAGSTGVPKHFLHYARLRSN